MRRTNVGCMWVKANARSYKLMVQVSDHLSQFSGWDQQVGQQAWAALETPRELVCKRS